MKSLLSKRLNLVANLTENFINFIENLTLDTCAKAKLVVYSVLEVEYVKLQ